MIARDVRKGTVSRLRAAGLTVDESRANPLQKADSLPRVLVATRGETDDFEGSGVAYARVRAEVTIEIAAQGASDVASTDAAEDVEELVKATLFSDPTWLALFDDVSSVTVQRDSTSEGHRHLATVVLTFAVTGVESYEEPIEDFGDFDKIDILNEVGDDDTPDIERMVDLT